MVTKENINRAWENAATIKGLNPEVYRRDELGNKLFRESYGKDTPMGWDLDHRKPKIMGGTDNPRNLRVLQRAANQEKGDSYP